MAAELFQVKLTDPGYLWLVAANLGTCVMPWGIFYQQSASIGKAAGRAGLAAMRLETLLGAILCQVVTAAVVVAAAAAFHHGAAGEGLGSVGRIADAFAVSVGPAAGRAVFALGLSGGALVAAIVVCLTAAWAFGEVFAPAGTRPAQGPHFRAAFAGVLILGAALVGSGLNLVALAIAAGVLNALLLPVVLWFLVRMALSELPAEVRPRGFHAVALAVVLALTAALGLYAGLAGLL
jgi:Mn2+/Fe2+ NRAMP family transporter